MNTHKTALIVLDFINGIAGNEPFKSHVEKQNAIHNANRLIAQARKAKQVLIFVKVGFSDSYAEIAHRSPMFTQTKANGWIKLSETSTDFHPDLDYQKGDLIVVKHRINAFYCTSLDAILNANEIEHLVLCGVSTNWAVEGTARDGHDRNYRITIAKDACAADSEENHQKSLSVISRIAAIQSVDEILTKAL